MNNRKNDIRRFTIIFILLLGLFVIVMISLFGCTKQPMYVSPPEPYLTIDKTVKFSGQKKVGSRIKFWVDMPTEFENDLQWYFDYGNTTSWKAGTDTIYFTYKKAGVYFVKVVGWNTTGTKLGMSDAAKLQILD